MKEIAMEANTPILVDKPPPHSAVGRYEERL